MGIKWAISDYFLEQLNLCAPNWVVTEPIHREFLAHRIQEIILKNPDKIKELIDGD